MSNDSPMLDASHMVPAKKQEPQTRFVIINHQEVVINGNIVPEPRKVPNNRVVTSKYTLLNFLPKNLFEQFRRIANFYFLCIAVIQVTTNSPVSPITSMAPLIFVVFTTAVKQAYEDWLRHKTDRATNNRMIPVLKNDKMDEIRSELIRVGDIVLLKDNEEIPCDMVVISSNSSNGSCHVTTANLDGETNLKARDCLPQTKHLQSPESLRNLKGVIECEKPNSDLYDFVGNMQIVDAEGQTHLHPLGPQNLLIRGSRLKNTQFTFGVAVYTGQETKLALNSRLTSNKFSTIEKTANSYLIVYLVLLILTSFFCTVIRCIYRNDPVMGLPEYIKGPDEEPERLSLAIVFEEFLAFFVIFNYIIPISLYVTLETVKFFGSKTLVNDPKLIDPESLEKPRCNSSDLNEELGQVEYLFSDKTGTLTENMMRFTSCSVDGTVYNSDEGKLLRKDSMGYHSTQLNKELEALLVAIAVCNTVKINRKENDSGPNSSDMSSNKPQDENQTIEYLADSPDEKALVEAAQSLGVVLMDSTDKTCDVSVGPKVMKFKKLDIFEFDSTRKRMSVITESEDRKLMLICKGADSEMRDLLSSGKINETFTHIDEYANHGLRTLVIASKPISREEYENVKRDMDQARKTLENRKEVISKAQAKLETNLQLMGATAVEDKLQDGVVETIEDLKKAGIKVWVLTGDKLETAVSVAYSCSLLDHRMKKLILARQANSDSCGECISRFALILHDVDATKPIPDNLKCALIVDGRSLYMAMKFHIDKFREVCQKCAIVVCCRMSPIQKAEVVHMVKNSKTHPVTAAIGDGANDVSMIQEAHVGFGLMGKEGRQAVNSSDFAFGRFRFLRRVLLVHGNLFYHRVSTLIQYFFYKNVIFVTPQVIYSFYNAFSSQTLYHGMLLMMYNMMFTATPILAFGIVEKHIPIETLSRDPSLYKDISRNRNMRPAKFISWFLNGIYHGFIVFYFFYILWLNSIFSNGQFLGLFAFGLTIYHGIILTVNLKLGVITKYWNFFFMFAILLSVILLFTFISLYTNFKWGLLNDDLYGVYSELLGSTNFWFSLFLCPFICLLPDVVLVILRNSQVTPPSFFSKRSVHVAPEVRSPPENNEQQERF